MNQKLTDILLEFLAGYIAEKHNFPKKKILKKLKEAGDNFESLYDYLEDFSFMDKKDNSPAYLRLLDQVVKSIDKS